MIISKDNENKMNNYYDCTPLIFLTPFNIQLMAEGSQQYHRELDT